MNNKKCFLIIRVIILNLAVHGVILTIKSMPLYQTKNTFFSGAKTMHGRLVGWSKYRFPVMNPHSKTVKQWNKFFVISCLFAIFVDPLFFLLFSVVEVISILFILKKL
jgi:hypothetical protein